MNKQPITKTQVVSTPKKIPEINIKQKVGMAARMNDLIAKKKK